MTLDWDWLRNIVVPPLLAALPALGRGNLPLARQMTADLLEGCMATYIRHDDIQSSLSRACAQLGWRALQRPLDRLLQKCLEGADDREHQRPAVPLLVAMAASSRAGGVLFFPWSAGPDVMLSRGLHA